MTDDAKARWRKISEGQLAASVEDAASRAKTQLALAQDALKALLLANGGALVALFTFVGNVLSKSGSVRFDLHHLWLAFVLFVAGFSLALVAHVLGFLSQDRFFQQAGAEIARITHSLLADEPNADQQVEMRLLASGQAFYWGGVLIAVLSLTAFACGSGFALAGVLV